MCRDDNLRASTTAHFRERDREFKTTISQHYMPLSSHCALHHRPRYRKSSTCYLFESVVESIIQYIIIQIYAFISSHENFQQIYNRKFKTLYYFRSIVWIIELKQYGVFLLQNKSFFFSSFGSWSDWKSNEIFLSTVMYNFGHSSDSKYRSLMWGRFLRITAWFLNAR